MSPKAASGFLVELAVKIYSNKACLDKLLTQAYKPTAENWLGEKIEFTY